MCLLGHALQFGNLLAAHDAAAGGVWTQAQAAELTASWPDCAPFLDSAQGHDGEEGEEGESIVDDGAEEVSVEDEYE
jgi:hypothetical protein